MSFGQLFPMHNSSSTLLREGALQYSVKLLQYGNQRHDEDKGLIKLLRSQNMILVNTGLKTPVILLKDEVTAGVPITEQARYNLVGIEDLTLEKVEMLYEPRLILPESHKLGIILPKLLNKEIVWIELTKIWRDRDKVKGLILNSMKGGYAVAIAGFVAFLLRSLFRKRKSKRNKFYLLINKQERFLNKQEIFCRGRFHGNRSGSGKFGNKGLRSRESRNRTSRRGRTFKISNMNRIKRNIVVKYIYSCYANEL
nr:ribosomal protein S subunit 1 [Haplopteris ensiformis]UQV94657.1 ribosomal protein S subunit 1 [Haplopteris ensiformis]UQV94741.1 ribosomal protein S subunit 1 [Haplopteris ensiformis]